MTKYLNRLSLIICSVALLVPLSLTVFIRASFSGSAPHSYSIYDPFKDYSTWTKVNGPVKPFLLSLAKFNYVQRNYISPHRFSFVDMNGDNLPDFLYHEDATATQGFYAIYYNNGGNNFNLAYKESRSDCFYPSYPNDIKKSPPETIVFV